MAKKQNRIVAFFETVVFASILLVLVHTVIQSIADLYGWTWTTRRILIYFGCAFDLLFSIEFLVRFFNAIRSKSIVHYIRNRRGWVDFIASVPLLILTSGPEALAAFNDIPTAASVVGAFGVIKVVKVIRIARVLRLLRLLKIFKHIRHADSTMAQRHITRISTTVITSIVICLVGFAIVSDLIELPNLEHSFEEHTIEVLENSVRSGTALADSEMLATYRPDILIIRQGTQTVYSRHANAYYDSYYGPSDYTIVEFPEDDVMVYIDLLPLIAHDARGDLLHFIIIIVLVFVLLFMYGPHFATTITDPVQIMSRGFSQKGYGLQVSLSNRFAQDEVYKLSSRYNEVYLPLKDRMEGGLAEGSVVDLQIEDVEEFLK